MGKDLGTYHVKVVFESGEGFIYKWPTGGGFAGEICRLEIAWNKPVWEDEEDLLHSIHWAFTEGNYSCDCNLKSFLDQSEQLDSDEYSCGDTLVIASLIVVRPDGSEIVLNLN